MTPLSKIEVISEVCGAISKNCHDSAVATLAEHYLFAPKLIQKRYCTPREATEVFVADGFIDRYSGEKLVFPPVFRVISLALPEKFPFHPNWKSDATHPAYWEIGATIDHFEPLSLGGKHEKSNWRTTSMARNAAKMNWTLEQLGWTLHAPGELQKWDGMMGWFLDYVEANPAVLHKDVDGIKSLAQWHIAAKEIRKSIPQPLSSSKHGL
jgi:hypothetical protein